MSTAPDRPPVLEWALVVVVLAILVVIALLVFGDRIEPISRFVPRR
ncbi:MAG: hypothetical protein M3024_04560 [Candidatus Dormibacteraeota bacterium]|nr:hypothetical protein [Candidatus Dormibacteraeota bacterium]